MITLPELDVVSRIIREAAEAEILPRFRNLKQGDIREKKPNQLVTDADVEAESLLARRLCELLPAAVVGEESVEHDASLLDALERPGPVWVIDPVDGTANFAHGRARFAVIVALVVDGETLAGWIHDPVPNRTITAVKGQGCFQGATRLHVAAEIPLDQMSGSVKKKGAVAGRVLNVGRRGSAAHDYLDLVTGQLHFAHFSRLMPWDHAAGVLLHAEAGGCGRLLDGRPYTPVNRPHDALLLTPGEATWDKLRPLID